MIVEENINKLLADLHHSDVADIDIGGFTIGVKVDSEKNVINLSTPVYSGGNYIPASVRACLKKEPPFDALSIKTSLFIDEDGFQVLLTCTGKINYGTKENFFDLIDDFSYLADKWHDYLDEHDKNDRVHILI